MNVFDLRGPEFLIVYLFLCLGVIALVLWYRTRVEQGDPPRLDFADPYLIAYLRGGEQEVTRVAVLSLYQRGAVQFVGDRVVRREGAGPARSGPTGIDAIERRVWELVGSGEDGDALARRMARSNPVHEYHQRLEGWRLLPDGEIRQRRVVAFAAAVLVLLLVAGIKVGVALARGRSNILGLIVLSVLGVCALSFVSFPRLTELGRRVLVDLRELYGGVRARVDQLASQDGSPEIVALAAVYGLGVLPGSAYGDLRHVFRRSADGSSSSSGCGASCGSSDGGGGGGGCGGGCGGCGS